MLRALESTDPEGIDAGARWFMRHPVDPERIIPLLVRGFEYSYAIYDCALALRIYGPRARFVIEKLVTLTKSNDERVPTLATWALEGIDPEVAKKTGVK